MKFVTQTALLAAILASQVNALVPRVQAPAHYRETSIGPNKLFAAPPIGNEISRAGWKVTCDSYEPGNECNKVMDNDNNTFWHTAYNNAPRPHQIVVDLGQTYNVNGISALPRQDNNNHGFITDHDVSVSTDGKNWESVASGSWHGGANGLKYSNFETKAIRYFRLKATGEVNGNPWTSIAELKAYQSKSGPIAYSGKGKWGPTIDFPTIPVAAAVDPNSGKVIVWAAYLYDEYLGSSGDRVYTAIWDPSTNTVVPKLVDNTDHDMFCPGISIDGTGKMVITGGNSANKTTIYDFDTGSWNPGPNMKIPRGYQSSATLSDGRVFTIGGSWSGGIYEKNGEVYNPKTKSWSTLDNALVHPMLTQDAGGLYRADNHGWFFGWKNGSVFQAGPSSAMNWYTTSGSGGVSGAGQRKSSRGVDPDSMCGNAVMFDATQGKILTVGGAPSYEKSQATANAHLITIGNPGSQAQVKFASNGMWSKRGFATSVVLPDGNVFITGGQSYAIPFNDDTPQLTPEMYIPSTDNFVQMQPNSIIRVYHSVSLLLPDGRVFNAGGGLCGFFCDVNHFDGQIYTPQYLLTSSGAPATRPVIKSVTQSGRRISISTDSSVSSASLIRYGTATHTVNTDQRRIPLTLNKAGTNQYTADAPSDSGILLPGYYMLFVLNSNGVPSVSKTVKFLV